MPDNTLTGAGLVEAGARAINGHAHDPHEASWARERWPEFAPHARAALRAAVEAAGVDAKTLKETAHWWKPRCAPEDDNPSSAGDRRVTALLRALAEVVEAGE